MNILVTGFECRLTRRVDRWLAHTGRHSRRITAASAAGRVLLLNNPHQTCSALFLMLQPLRAVCTRVVVSVQRSSARSMHVENGYQTYTGSCNCHWHGIALGGLSYDSCRWHLDQRPAPAAESKMHTTKPLETESLWNS